MSKLAAKYDKLILYFFSGTGNSRNAARWIASAAEKQGIHTTLINIEKFETVEIPTLSERILIGFCFPTHGFNAPPIVIKFLRKFPFTKGADAFLLNTRAGMKLHKFFVPGLSGLAQILPALMLIFKGFGMVGMQPLDLPSNWLIIHPGLRKKVVNSIYHRCHRIVDDFASKMLSGRRSYKALWSLPIDLALLPIAAAYYFVGRFFLAKTLISTDACNQCGKCVTQCPVNAISMVNERPFWSYTCESCMRCVNVCPERAIETVHSFSISLLLLSSFVISPLLISIMKHVGLWKWVTGSTLVGHAWSVIDAVVFLLFTFLSYRLLHFLMRYRIVNRVISYTSLSKYTFWRRYKAPKSH